MARLSEQQGPNVMERKMIKLNNVSPFCQQNFMFYFYFDLLW